jgi:RNA polymerase sigma factor (sigma-70 family)
LDVDLPDRRETREMQVDQVERRVQVRRAILKLSVRERRLILAAYWLRWTPTRIAERLNISPATVPGAACRARKKLRAILGDDFMQSITA